jgi:hypothetical protein
MGGYGGLSRYCPLSRLSSFFTKYLIEYIIYIGTIEKAGPSGTKDKSGTNTLYHSVYDTMYGVWFIPSSL